LEAAAMTIEILDMPDVNEVLEEYVRARRRERAAGGIERAPDESHVHEGASPESDPHPGRSALPKISTKVSDPP
jgi:hypothetical protein